MPPVVTWRVDGDPPVDHGGRGGTLHGLAARWWRCMAPARATDLVDDDVVNALRGAAAMATLLDRHGTARELTAMVDAWGLTVTATTVDAPEAVTP